MHRHILLLLHFFQIVFGQGNSTGACFNCANKPCANFGICANGACQCSDGFGDLDCSKPLCGSLAQLPSQRPIRANKTTCACASGFTGPTCNICTNDDVCRNFPGTLLGSENVCNAGPKVWGEKHMAYCQVKNTLLQLAYPKPAQVTLNRNLEKGVVLATMWMDETPQFTCNASECSQKVSKNGTTWACQNSRCFCNVGTEMCGGGSLNIAEAVNSASGEISIVCQNSQDCVLNLAFIKDIIPTGIELRQCVFGECADKLKEPLALSDDSNAALDAVAIAAVALGSFLVLLLILFIVISCIDQTKKRKAPMDNETITVDFGFENISYSIKDKQILSNISGRVHPGEILAIMGPSGSGKSTCLDILAGKSKIGEKSGKVTINGSDDFDLHHLARISGYVDQDDLHLEELTVREVLDFSASLRLPESMPKELKKFRVEEVLEQLGLKHIADSRVGGITKRGISGGERRRLSIGVELVTNPSLLFLDEPTSGLDSYNALHLIKVLSKLAKDSNKTIIFSIHQPNSAIYSLFDKVLLLSGGHIKYYGKSEEAAAVLAERGSACPQHYHISDFMLDYASEDKVYKANDVKEQVDEFGLRRRKDLSPVQGQFEKKSIEIQAKASRLTQMQCVINRSAKIFWRNPILFYAHLGLSVFMGLFIGFLYYKVDSTLGGIQNRLGSVFFIQSLLGFAGLSAIASLDYDKALFIRERSNGFYGYFPYFVTKVLFDVLPLRVLPAIVMASISYFLIGFNPEPITFLKYLLIMVLFSVNCGLYCLFIGCAIPGSTAILVASITMLFQMLFAGILVNQTEIPLALRWIQYLSFFKYAYEACVANDAKSLTLIDKLGGVTFTVPASSILSKFGLDVNSYYRNLLVCFGLMVAFLILIALVMNKRLRMQK